MNDSSTSTMDRKRWQKIDFILDEALKLDNYQERKRYINVVCDNKNLKDEILVLLRFIQEANETDFLE